MSLGAFASDWPIFRGPNHNGISNETAWSPAFSEDGPNVLWREKIGTGFSAFTVVGPRAYITGNVNDTDYIHCFDAATGKKLWHHTYPEKLDPKYYEGGTSASVTIADGKAYCLSRTGDVLCLDAASGAVVWNVDLHDKYGIEIPTWGLAGSPYVTGDLVVLNAGSYGMALNKTTGVLVWQNGKNAAGYATPVPFDQGGRDLLLLFVKDELAAVEPLTGNVVWTYPWKTNHDVNAADPILNGSRIFISSGYNHGAALIDTASGSPSLVWESRVMRNHFNSCVLWKGFLYGFDEKELKCIEFATGAEKWSQGGLGKGSLMLASGTLIIFSENGQLITAKPSPDKFDVISKAKILSGRCWSMPVLANGRIFVRNAEGDAACVDVSAPEKQSVSASSSAGSSDWCQWMGPNRDGVSPETGLLKQWPETGPEMLWSFEDLGAGYASAVICSGTVYVPGTHDAVGYMYAFDEHTGKLKWKKPYGAEWTKSFPGSRSTPAVKDGKLYVITGLGEVVCLDASTGDKLWSRDMVSDFDAKHKAWGFATCPLVYDDKIIFAPGGPKTTILALNKDSGQIIWQTESTGEVNAYCSPMLVERGGKKILIHMLSDSVWFLNADDGSVIQRELYSSYLENPKDISPNTPLYHDGWVFTTTGYDAGGAMFEISADGSAVTRKWTGDTLDVHHGGVVRVGGYIYGSNWKGNPAGDWVCLDWQTGKVLYETAWFGKGSIIAAEGMLYCYEEKQGHVALVKASPAAFEIVSSFKVPLGEKEHWSHPTICNKKLYVRHGSALMVYDIAAK